MLQQRLTDRLITHWQRHHEDGHCPDISKLKPSALADIWPGCILLAAQPSAASATRLFQYSQLGEKARHLFPHDPTGQYVTPGAKVSPTARLIEKIGLLTTASDPVLDDGQFVNERHKIIKFRSCMLPYGRNTELTHVLLGLSWREF